MGVYYNFGKYDSSNVVYSHTIKDAITRPISYGGVNFDGKNPLYSVYATTSSQTASSMRLYGMWLYFSETTSVNVHYANWLGFNTLVYCPNATTTVEGYSLEGSYGTQNGVYISGKYRTKTALFNTPHYSLVLGTVCVNYSVRGNSYTGIMFAGSTTFDFTGSNKTTYTTSVNSIGLYKGYPAYNEIPDYDVITSNNNLKEEYYNTIFDFGVVQQEVPYMFKKWLDDNFDQVFDNSFTVKNQNGTEELAHISEAPKMVKGNLNVIGNTKTFVLTGINDKKYTLTWDSVTPDGEQFTGLSFSPNSKVANIPVGIETNFNLEGDVSLYECYGIYRPPITTFDINLYQNSSEPNRLDKTNYLTAIGTLEGTLRDESSITDIVITFESTNVPNFNYVYIPIFNRYYFVNDITSLKYKLWQVSLSVDTLMTYKNAILSCRGFVDRNERASSPMIVDKKRVVRSGKTVSYTAIPNELFTETNGWYVLNGLALSTHGGDE